MFFRRKKPKLEAKKEIPDGLWIKCNSCGEILYRKELAKKLWICEKCGYHFKIDSRRYVSILTDEFNELFSEFSPVNSLGFRDYEEKLEKDYKKTGLKDAIICGEAEIGNHNVVLSCMDFFFRGGSMGSVVGEKVKLSILHAMNRKIPLIVVCASGGARMQEGILSLMQMAKTSATLNLLADARIPYISILTNPTTAGVMASYASLGDIVIAEPGALIGFAGPRVIRDTVREELPPGFQTSEFLLEHGMLDAVVPRDRLKETLIGILDFFKS
ncbi:acetyl-CoA carboxylase, carboxyltransferase subunit beta [candidate division WOR-3 bacterium JGI_Cruoil_03_44_89]|uniref:Acetyl-coenzyme A carboxylase carboxyl transferase subunit beta n=1 Tax=candidate division WOR-3 bacterium JGI_Cruoil_03_44_89 TaxID=1973748 RepID=A0A235BNN0_UNCW3|nr:MAG: acetyl-CoA carboxylase, carboxyltransferase subunit beta [candidate division WOR-3 bacterium JGI_Cruoil_03_44_89]